MTGHVLTIKGETPHSQKPFDIQLGGKSLIVTGKNGSGKTSFLKKLLETFQKHIREKKDEHEVWSLKGNIRMHEQNLIAHSEGSSEHAHAGRMRAHFERELRILEELFTVEYDERLSFAGGIDTGNAVIEFFDASRQSSIAQSNGAGAVDEEQTRQLVLLHHESNLGTQLEQYLVNLKVRHAFAKNKAADQELMQGIERWFAEFDANLQYLIEQDDACLDFDEAKLQVSIKHGNQHYTFQQLSSGYSAIFSIYAALLVRVRYLSITPDQLTGVVLIDEIDAHLHLSLQRKILPFLMRSFPNVQFIVSTHSPFVLTSVQNVAVYDISRCEQVDEELSLYSYQVVAEGLLGVDPASDVLLEKVQRLAKLTAERTITDEFKILLEELSAHDDKMDDESRFFVNQAKLLVSRSV